MRRDLLLLLFLCVGLGLYAQEPIRFGDREVYLEANVHSKVRGQKNSSLELGVPTGDRLNVLVQFGSGKIAYDALMQKGVELGDYLGSNAYYAQVVPGSHSSDFAGTGLRSVVPIRAEWKVVNSLLKNEIPEWVQEGNELKMTLSWFSTVSWSTVKKILQAKGIKTSASGVSEILRTTEVQGTREQLLELASEEFVSFIHWIAPPQELHNREGARLSGASTLRVSSTLGGRALTGKGIRIGIWDGDVLEHVDYGKRTHCEELELSVASTQAHGMHTTGTIIGAGLLDDRARGMAPEAEIWTWNFNRQSNGKIPAQEMLETYETHHISLTSNSYGYQLSRLCGQEARFNYTYFGYQPVDILSFYIPTLTHVFSAGNDQGACKKAYSHSANYAKNIISVAAVNPFGAMTDFSSFGPLLDGRMYPIISARGEQVYSTVNHQEYKEMDGTSMACPIVTGHLALLTQRWQQLHGGALPYNYYLKALIANTARDAGNPGPDYKYGFGILDAEAAVVAMENGWHKLDQLSQGAAAQTYTIDVPEGAKELRVLLCWNDPVAQKEYATGDCPLVNDLDLSVDYGSTKYYPFTLDAKQPDAAALSTQKNTLDNIEQVVIKTPVAGRYTVSVGGTVNQGAKQPYAVVWYFDKQKPTLAAPLVGDNYAPSESIYLRAENMVGDLRLELSTDAGSTFRDLGTFATCSAFKLPSDAPLTDKALVRVTDLNGTVLQMQGYFTIMPQVQNVELQDAACSAEGWKLTWEAVEGAAKYEILCGNVATGDYDKLDEVQVPTTEYLIPTDKISGDRNIYAVRAVNATGLVGRRSVGVLSTKPKAMILKPTDLPYLESFVGWPLHNASASRGRNLGIEVQESPIGMDLPRGSQMLIWFAKTSAGGGWEDPFKNYARNIGALDICSLDLSSIDAGTELELVAYVYMKKPTMKKGTLLRLLVDNKEQIDTQGRNQIEGDGEEHRIAWDLTPFVGKKVALRFETAMRTKNDAIILAYYQIIPKTKHPDVSLAWVNHPEIETKVNMREEVVRFKVRNNSSQELHNVPIAVLVDGALSYSETLETLKPFEDRVITHTHDFTSAAAHKYSVEVRVAAEGDHNPDNNADTFEVYNIGDVLAMPELSYNEASMPVVPYKSVTISGKRTFVDGQGALAPYNRDEDAVLQVLPTEPNATIQVNFSEYDFAEGDTLAIYKGNVPADLKVDFRKASAYLTGKANTAQTFVAEAENGGLTFAFKGTNRVPAAGWVSEIREVVMANQWKLNTLTTTEGADANHKKLHAEIENLLPIPLYNVVMTVKINEVTERIVIPTLAKGVTDFVLPKELDVTPPSNLTITCILARDGDTSDNRKELTILNDPLWHEGTIKKERDLYINTLTAKGCEPLQVGASKQVIYKPQYVAPMYATGKNGVEITLSRNPRQEKLPSQIRVWVDANGNNILEDTELSIAELDKTQNKYWIEIDLSQITELKAGKQRARAMLSTAADYILFKEGKEIEWGCVVDFTADIKQEPNPYDYELAVLALEDLKTGRDLSNETPVKVKLQNNGLSPLQKVKLSYQLDDEAVETEEIPCTLPPRGGEAVVEFTQKADLSRKGKHTLKVMLVDKDSNEEDNVKEVVVYCIPPQTSNLYGLQFVGNRKEALYLPEVGKAIVGQVDKMTFEGWWKLNESKSCEFINGSGLWLANLVGEKDYPDNTLVFLAGENGAFVSEKPAVTIGKWHHIAVSVVQSGWWSVVATPTVYIDGEEIDMKKLGGAEVRFSHLWLNGGLNGNNAMFRLWKKACTQEEVKANMTKSVRLADGKLPEECVGEYLFTEGEGTVTAYGDERFALILSERNDLWQPLQGVVNSVVIEGQQTTTQFTTADEITVTMPKDFTSFDKVKAKFILHWPEAKVMHNAQEVTEDTELNFSNTEHKLHFTAQKTDLFGTTLTQQFDVKLVNDLSDACDLLKLSLLTAKNKGLKEDLVIENPERVIVLEAEEESNQHLDAQKVVLVVNSISTGAKLYKGTELIQAGDDLQVDLTTPLVLRVEAQNGRKSKHYTLRLSMPQSLSWETTPLEYTYTSTLQPLNATSSSQLPVMYYSLDPNIATVDAQGNLITVGIGTTTLVASQTGSNVYKPAESIQRDIKVTPANLTIKVKDVTMPQGDALPEFEFEYDGLQYAETEYLVEHPYEVRKSDGTVWKTGMLPLEVGTYTLAPKDYSAPYTAANYRITCQEGTLTVTSPQAAQEVTFVVRDENNEALKDATLQWTGMLPTQSSTDGMVKVHLHPGRYQVVASKTGYKHVKKSFVVQASALQIELQLLKEVHTLTYTAGEHGIVQGVILQKVANGQDGSDVVAVANGIQYRFKQWSDGRREAVRTDKNVRGDVSVTAEFEAYHHTLTYEVDEGGEWVSGEKVQTVVPGQDGTPVTIKEKPGYLFAGWSDQIPDRTRTDRKVTKDLTVRACFTKACLLAWSEDFETDATTLRDWTFGPHKKGMGWMRRPMSDLKDLPSPSGNVLAITPLYEQGYNYYEHCWVATPWLSLEGRDPASKVVLSFTRYYKKSTNVYAMIEYAFEEGGWHVGKTITAGTGTTPETFELDAATLGSHKYIRYRWYLSNSETLSAYLALDNISVKFNPEPATATPILRYYAAEHGAVKKADATTALLYLEFTPTGNDTDEVTAIPDQGYAFDKWSDGVTNPKRKDNATLTVVARFKKILKPTHKVQYIAGANGTLNGILYQVVEEGEASAAVTAIGTSDYEFKVWDDGKSDNPRTDLLTKDETFTALFARFFTLTYNAGTNGTIRGNATQKVEEGASGIEVEALPNTGYRFKKWDDGVTTAKRTETNVQASKTYTAEFIQVFTLNYVAGSNGTIEGDARQTVDAGGSGTAVTAKANAGYRFVQWDDGKTDNPRTDINVTESKTYTAEFEADTPKTFVVTLAPVEGQGELKIVGIAEDKLNAVPAGTELMAVATPKDGWKLKSLMAGDKDISADGKFTVTSDVEVKSVFEEKDNPNPPSPDPNVVNDAILANVQVIPNPFTTALRLICNGSTGCYELLNAQGIVVRSGNMDGNEVVIETNDLTSGHYLLRLTAVNGATKTTMVVKN